MADESTKNLLCLVCGEPSYVTETPSACPFCGDQSAPADLDKMVTISLTEHELRILTFWTEAYARLYERIGYDPTRRMSLMVKTIFDRLSMQTTTPLSLTQDMANVRAEMQQKLGHSIDLVAFDGTGKCLECDAPLDLNDEEALFKHRCGVSDDELPTPDEGGTPATS